VLFHKELLSCLIPIFANLWRRSGTAKAGWRRWFSLNSECFKLTRIQYFTAHASATI
jgi:hypothetical protein